MFPTGLGKARLWSTCSKGRNTCGGRMQTSRSYLWFVYLKLDVLKGPAHGVYNCAFLWVRLFYYITFSIVIKKGLWSKAFTVC